MTEEFDELIKKTQEQSNLQKRMQKELREYNGLRLHYIFTLSLSDGFLNLNSIYGWHKYINLNIGLYLEFFKCVIKKNAVYPENFNTEQFILSKIIGRLSTQMCECSFEGIEFKVFTNGKAFEVILDPFDKGLGLKFSDGDSHKLGDFFKRWAGEVLVNSFSLEEYIDRSLEGSYESIYDSVLELEFLSFVIYTYPDSIENTKIKELIERNFKFPKKPILTNIWTTYGACIRDGFNAPFHEYSIHIKGHVPNEYPYDLMDCLKILYRHMNFWSMVYNFEKFMGNIPAFQYLETCNSKIFIKKRDVFKRLILGKDVELIEIESIGKIKRFILDFLNLGLKSNHKGLEEYASEQYIPSNIVNEYISLFENEKLTTEVLDNATEKNIKRLREELNELWGELEKRIEKLIENIRDLEVKYYQEYQLRHVEKTQELTILSILIAVSIFLISKLPFDLITQENILTFWNYLKNLFLGHIY